MKYEHLVPQDEQLVLDLIAHGREREAIESLKALGEIISYPLMAQLILVFWFNRLLEKSTVVWPDKLNKLLNDLPKKLHAERKSLVPPIDEEFIALEDWCYGLVKLVQSISLDDGGVEPGENQDGTVLRTGGYGAFPKEITDRMFNRCYCGPHYYGEEVDDVDIGLRRIVSAAKHGLPDAVMFLAEVFAYGLFGVKVNSHKAFVLTRLAADKGVLKALMALGRMYFTGTGVEKDTYEGMRLTEQAVELGYIPAKIQKADFLLAGNPSVDVVSECLEVYNDVANRYKNPVAMTRMGELYEFGQHVKKDLDAACEWYAQACVLNYAEAQYKRARLGFLVGCEKAQTKLSRNFLTLATPLMPEAQYLEGLLCERESGKETDNVSMGYAWGWYYRAARNGNTDAMWRLGKMYYEMLESCKPHPEFCYDAFVYPQFVVRGLGRELSHEIIEYVGTKAELFLWDAAISGNANAAKFLVELYRRYVKDGERHPIHSYVELAQLIEDFSTPEFSLQALRLYEYAAKNEDLHAIYILSRAYSGAYLPLNSVVAVDYSKSRSLLQFCVDKYFARRDKVVCEEFGLAANRYAVMLEKGIGGSVDIIGAEKWYDVAIRGTNSIAAYNLSRLYKRKGLDGIANTLFRKFVEDVDAQTMKRMDCNGADGLRTQLGWKYTTQFVSELCDWIEDVESKCDTPDDGNSRLYSFSPPKVEGGEVLDLGKYNEDMARIVENRQRLYDCDNGIADDDDAEYYVDGTPVYDVGSQEEAEMVYWNTH